MKNANRKSILCPNCKKLISKNERKCPYCGMADPGSQIKGLFLKFFYQPEVFVKTIIGINIGLYVFSLLISTRILRGMHNPLLMLSPDGRVLSLIGATGRSVVSGSHGLWTLVAANYLHGSIIHILFNMMVFWQLCPLVIREYGISRTMIIYTLSGVTGFAVSVLAGVNSTIGASAAVCGLMGALIYYGKSRGGIYGQTIYKQIGGWAVGIFVFGLLIPTINNWAHAGGMMGGAMAGFLLGYEERIREKAGHKLLAKILTLLTAAVLMWAVFLGVVFRFLM